MSEEQAVETTDEIVDVIETEEASDNTEENSDVENSETEDDQHEDEVVVTIGEGSPSSDDEETTSAPQWVKDLRKEHRELKREKRELERRLQSVTEEEIKPVKLGEKPTLAGEDFDSEVYERKLAEWYDRKREVDEQVKAAKAEKENQQKAWKTKLDTYEAKKVGVKVKDFAEAEDVARDILSITQQGIILQGAKDPALLVYAIGKNETKAREIAAITDPVEFAFAAAALEAQLKVSKRKAPAPEKTISGSAKSGGAIDSTLERLRAEAEKTGDLSKVIAYKRKKKNSA